MFDILITTLGILGIFVGGATLDGDSILTGLVLCLFGALFLIWENVRYGQGRSRFSQKR